MEPQELWIHYLTELNWINKNNYLVNGKKWVWIFIFLSLLILIPSLLNLPIVSDFEDYLVINNLSKFFNRIRNELILMMFLFAIGLVLFKKWQHLLLSLLVSLISGFIIVKYIPFSYIIVGLFLPTIIHVYLFALVFMISGNSNNKTKEGLTGIVRLPVCPIVILGTHIIPSDYVLSAHTKTSYLTSTFSILSSYLAKILSPSEKEKFYFLSEIGIKLQIFIAFCYTYHYLNWFSKTSITGWSKSLSKRNIPIVFLL